MKLFLAEKTGRRMDGHEANNRFSQHFANAFNRAVLSEETSSSKGPKMVESILQPFPLFQKQIQFLTPSGSNKHKTIRKVQNTVKPTAFICFMVFFICQIKKNFDFMSLASYILIIRGETKLTSRLLPTHEISK